MGEDSERLPGSIGTLLKDCTNLRIRGICCKEELLLGLGTIWRGVDQGEEEQRMMPNFSSSRNVCSVKICEVKQPVVGQWHGYVEGGIVGLSQEKEDWEVTEGNWLRMD